MARREITQYFDDIDNTPLDAGEVQVVRFSYNNAHYVLDLSAENARKFADLIAPYIESGTREMITPAARATSRNARRAANDGARDRNRIIRAWARESGMPVKDRGQLPREIIDAYDQAHGTK